MYRASQPISAGTDSIPDLVSAKPWSEHFSCIYVHRGLCVCACVRHRLYVQHVHPSQCVVSHCGRPQPAVKWLPVFDLNSEFHANQPCFLIISSPTRPYLSSFLLIICPLVFTYFILIFFLSFIYTAPCLSLTISPGLPSPSYCLLLQAFNVHSGAAHC